MDLFVDVVQKCITTLQLNEIILCGHALGGAITQSFYLKYPEKVSALILIDTGAKLRVSPYILNTVKINYQEFLDSLSVGIFYRKTSPQIVDEYVRQSMDIKPEVAYSDFKICDNFDAIGQISSIKVPTLIICGKEDKIAPLKYSMFFNEKIVNSKLIVIPKASHMVMLEQPQEVNKAIEEFLKK